MDLPEDLDNLREKAWTQQHGRLQNRNGKYESNDTLSIKNSGTTGHYFTTN